MKIETEVRDQYYLLRTYKSKWPDSVPNQIFGASDCFLLARPKA
jgi:hypothetical protein